MAAQAGAGGSVFSIAGACAVSIIDSAFKVSVDGILRVRYREDRYGSQCGAVCTGTIAAAEPVRSIAGKRIRRREQRNNKGPSGKVGIGASFALADIKTNVSVKTANGAVLKSAREVKAKSNFTNRVTTKAESGDDVIEDDEGISDKLTAFNGPEKNTARRHWISCGGHINNRYDRGSSTGRATGSGYTEYNRWWEFNC